MIMAELLSGVILNFADMQGAHVLFQLVSSLSLSHLYGWNAHTFKHKHFHTCAQHFSLQCDVHLFYSLTVPPAYYAHLAAFRARFYMEPETSDSGSLTSETISGRGGMGGAAPRSTRGPGAPTVRPLPALKENVKRVMFYC